jgi:glycyl-tRNA synthetase beta chain
MPELLFELGCEEIPAEDLFVLPDELKRIATNVFENNRLVFNGLETEATPRRLVLHGQVEAIQTTLRDQRMGPPSKVALDAAGNPTPAGLGFAKNAGVPFEKLKFVSTPKGEYVAAEIVVKGKLAARVLKDVMPMVITQLPFHKFMRWQSGDFLFGRPIRQILFLFDGKTVPFVIAGVKAGKYTFGHRFLGKKKIKVKSYEEYKDKLHENGVILRTQDRISLIQDQLAQHAMASGGRLQADEELLNLMSNEVEFPEVMSGNFPSSFLALPQEILINAMRKHQKYFCSVDAAGKLLPVFHTVLNTKASKPELIRQGHERVLLARLRDAEFFWQEDRKIPLEARIPGLERLTYQEKLGSYAQKIERMKAIGNQMSQQLGDRSVSESLPTLISLCKVDLMTHMVGEFPELQGKMCGLYAEAEGYPENFWQALYDQYLPVSVDDPVPRRIEGAVLSLVDRVETLTSGFVLNMIPTGSKDPYALRRIAAGAMKIVLEFKLNVDFQEFFGHALTLYTVKIKLTAGELLRGLLDLMESRFRFLMEQKGISHDYLNAILSANDHSYVDAHAKTSALWRLENSDQLKVLARGFKRINNIIFDQPHHSFDSEKLQEDGEIRLHRAFTDLAFRVEQNILDKNYDDALEIMVTLGPEIDNFFDEVMVMVEQPELRNNRIALLQQISDMYRKIADFSALQIDISPQSTQSAQS